MGQRLLQGRFPPFRALDHEIASRRWVLARGIVDARDGPGLGMEMHATESRASRALQMRVGSHLPAVGPDRGSTRNTT